VHNVIRIVLLLSNQQRLAAGQLIRRYGAPNLLPNNNSNLLNNKRPDETR